MVIAHRLLAFELGFLGVWVVQAVFVGFPGYLGFYGHCCEVLLGVRDGCFVGVVFGPWWWFVFALDDLWNFCLLEG